MPSLVPVRFELELLGTPQPDAAHRFQKDDSAVVDWAVKRVAAGTLRPVPAQTVKFSLPISVLQVARSQVIDAWLAISDNLMLLLKYFHLSHLTVDLSRYGLASTLGVLR